MSPDFSRDLQVAFGDVASLAMSAAPAFRGVRSRLNPELLVVGALSACQALSYLYLAARDGIPVAGYADVAEGRLGFANGRMRITQIMLRPTITLAHGTDEERARGLVATAHDQCFVANSLATKVTIDPTFVLA
jgi:organic hydroperoxide reductase OsmC/OhrA